MRRKIRALSIHEKCVKNMNWNWTNTYTYRVDVMSLRGGACVLGSLLAEVSVEMPQKDFIAHEPGGSLR